MNNSINQKIADALNPALLHLIILPTEKCNFRCTYCYEDFAIGKMKDEVQESILNFIKLRISGLRKLSIDWFGGEPLLAKDVVMNMMKEVSVLIRNKDIHLTSEMTTNAYLLSKDVFEELVRLKVTNYQITLDGTSDMHNTTRIKANGSGTFHRIWANLNEIKKSELNFNITLRVHLNSRNIHDIPELIKMINDSFGNDSRFKVFLKPVEALGSINDSKFEFLKNTDKKSISNYFNSKLSENLQSNFSDATYVCYASKANSFVFRSDGKINKCTVALNDDRNYVGRVKLDGSLELYNDKMRLWMTGLQTQEKQMLSCPNSVL